MDFKERMARAAERAKKRRMAIREEALELGVEDVDAYVQAVIEAEDGPSIDDMQDDPLLPLGQSLH